MPRQVMYAPARKPFQCLMPGCSRTTQKRRNWNICHGCERWWNLGVRDIVEHRRRRNGRCENRRCPERRALNLDHDHSCCPAGATKRCGNCNRGYLCTTCNLRLGYLETHRERWRDAAIADEWALGLLEYLWRYKHGVKH